jgi:ABC-2 type transport system ATP-binding protein
MKTMKNIVLKVHNLTKIYAASRWFFRKAAKPFVAVDHISFELRGGEILGLLGANGAGKTTTIQMLLSTLTPTAGSIEYFGKDFFKYRSEILQQVGFASTYVSLPARLTVYENLYVHGNLYAIAHGELLERIKKFLKFFDLWSLRDREAEALSAGQKTRVMLIKALMTYPKIALLDEPTAALDPDVAHEVREFILKQQREQGLSVLFTSHNMDEVTYVCNRVLVLQHGTIIASDQPDRLAARISTSRVQLVVGDGLKRTIAYLNEHKLPYKLFERFIEISIEEHKIAALLTSLAHAGIAYSQIAIEKPTLGDYFFSLAQQAKKKKKG